MGDESVLEGWISIVPPLNPYEVEFLDRFAETRHVYRSDGPHVVNENDDSAGEPPPELSGYRCPWVPAAAGDALIHDGGRNLRHAEVWLAYLIDTFLRPGAAIEAARAEPVGGRFYPALLEHFTCDHVLNGVIEAAGGEDDLQRIEVRDGVVHVVRRVARPEPAGVAPRGPGEGTEVDRNGRRDQASTVSGGTPRDLGPADDAGFAPRENAGFAPGENAGFAQGERPGGDHRS